MFGKRMWTCRLKTFVSNEVLGLISWYTLTVFVTREMTIFCIMLYGLHLKSIMFHHVNKLMNFLDTPIIEVTNTRRTLKEVKWLAQGHLEAWWLSELPGGAPHQPYPQNACLPCARHRVTYHQEIKMSGIGPRNPTRGKKHLASSTALSNVLHSLHPWLDSFHRTMCCGILLAPAVISWVGKVIKTATIGSCAPTRQQSQPIAASGWHLSQITKGTREPKYTC